uniref:RNase H type-1 domain-containing protein n=1 Tax=Cannabis sativa TaxID=3483 RepID=A0A803PZY4_CANSA
MRKRIEGWKMKLLSYAGRLTLIKSVSASMPIYAMSTNKIPVTTCRELDAIIRKFWWLGNAEKDRFMALRSWDSICQPKASGGLGLRRFEDINKALSAKLGWFLACRSDKPWVTYLLKKYCSTENFWRVKPKDSDSALWKNFLGTRDLVRAGSMAICASGESIDFWRQPWIPWLNPLEFDDLMSSLRTQRFTARSLADVSIGQNWNEELLLQIFGEDLGRRIVTIPRIPGGYKDRVVWKARNHGNFSVKDAYVLDQGYKFGLRKDIWKWIWEPGIHPRISLMLWKVLNDALPTVARISVITQFGCCFCDRDLEDSIHLFKECAFVKAICAFVEYSDCSVEDLSVDWYVPFDNLLVQSDIADHILFTDSSWKDGFGGFAVVAINRSTNSWIYKLESCAASCPLEAETRAILSALELAVQNSWTRIHIQSDCRVLVNALEQRSPPPDWRFLNVSLLVLDLLNVISDCSFFFVHRNSNAVADGLAKSARLSSHESGIFQGEGIPPVIPSYFSLS